MAFIDNSGDIILDAVLTDAGRQRMARGNFKITKFALGDEEINYGIYNSSHPSGSAFYDLEVMQTPILEAFTNNTSLMKSKLVSMNRNNILFMPILKLNNREQNGTQQAAQHITDGFMLLADKKTEENNTNQRIPNFKQGILRGQDPDVTNVTTHIAVDQGIDSTQEGLSFTQELSDDLVETAFLIRVDSRLLTLHEIIPGNNNVGGTRSLTNSFIDDDGIASYYVALGDGTTCVEGKPGSAVVFSDARGPAGANSARADLIGNPDALTVAGVQETFGGPLGSILRIYPRASMHVQQSSALFDELGTTVASGTNITVTDTVTISAYKFIDTVINVVGVSTGYSIDIPIRIVRLT